MRPFTARNHRVPTTKGILLCEIQPTKRSTLVAAGVAEAEAIHLCDRRARAKGTGVALPKGGESVRAEMPLY